MLCWFQQHSDSVIHINIAVSFRFFPHVAYHRILSGGPYGIQQVLADYLFYIRLNSQQRHPVSSITSVRISNNEFVCSLVSLSLVKYYKLQEGRELVSSLTTVSPPTGTEPAYTSFQQIAEFRLPVKWC